MAHLYKHFDGFDSVMFDVIPIRHSGLKFSLNARLVNKFI